MNSLLLIIVPLIGAALAALVLAEQPDPALAAAGRRPRACRDGVLAVP